MNKLKIVITGASGFVGKNLLNLLDENQYDITVITRNKKKLENSIGNSIRIIEADLLDVDSLKVGFEGQDVLINLAAEVRNYDLLEKTNIQGTQNCIEAIQYSIIKKVIHLSSVGVVGKPYSASAIQIDENCNPTPQNEYERTKLISEKLFIEASVSHSFDLVVFRPTNVFGENHPFNALLNLMQTIERRKSLIYTQGAKVNYVYVSDLSSTIISVLNGDINSGIYNVGYSMELRKFYSIIMAAMKSKTTIIRVPSILVKFASKLGINKLKSISNQLEYSDERLKQNFSYPFGVEKGIQKTVNYYKQKGALK